MSEVSTAAKGSLVQRLAQHTVLIITIVIGSFAFHWQSMHAEEQRARERSDVRVQTLAETSSIALREPLLSKNVPAAMILIEGLARETPGVLSARVGGKDGQTIAETEAEHIDEADSRDARALTLPILVKDGSGVAAAIGTLDLRISTKEVEEVAAANRQLVIIEGALCLLLCGGLFAITRKLGQASATPAARQAVTSQPVPAVSLAKAAKPAKAAAQPRGPRPSSSRAPVDEAVEVSLNSPPPAESH
jgi:hypothetical protein